jgi:hypothetical protein
MDKILSTVIMGVHAAKLLSDLLYGESSSTMARPVHYKLTVMEKVYS